jgi:hypothetical protein
MEPLIDKLTGAFAVIVSAALAAALVAYIAHYQFGLTRSQIRTDALIGAAALTTAILLLNGKFPNT